MPLLKPKKLKLHKALQIGYLRNETKQAKRLKRFGYKLDPELTNREHLVAVNENGNLLFISNGTNFTNARDIHNDIAGAIGLQKSTERYKQEKNDLLKAKEKYHPKKTTLVSHSLGSQYTNYIASPEDKVIQFNPYYTAGAKARSNVTNYRTKMDVVSAFSPQSNTKLVESDKINPITAHNIDESKGLPVFI